MTTTAPGRTEYAPAHAQLLLKSDGYPGAAVVRVALLHLAALGALRTEREIHQGRFFSSTSFRIVRASGRTTLPPHLAVLLGALFPPGDRGAFLVPTEAVRRLQKAFGYGYERYVESHVRPALVKRELLAREERRLLGIFPRRGWRLTPAGERARADLDARLREAAAIPPLLQREPRKAAAAAASLGALVLVADVLRPHYAALGGALRAHGAGLAVAPDALALLEEEDDRRTAWMEVMEALTQVDWAGVLDALGDVADAFDAGGGDAGAGAGDGGDGGGGGGGE